MKILVVDDNPHVLALMQHALESHGEVEAYHDGGEALTRATMSPPDLIVSDYRLKGGINGKALVQRLRGRAETKEVAVILVAAKSDIEEELQSVVDQVDDLLAKPFFARDLSSRAKRALDKVFLNRKQKESAASGGAFRGKLSEMNIMDLFQAMEMGAKTCLLTLNDGDSNANIYFSEGQVYHCIMTTPSGEVVSDAVVNKVVKWPDGQFEINFTAPKASGSNSNTGTQGLLMEAMRLMDEDNR